MLTKQVGSTTLKKNLLILSDLSPEQKRNIELHTHEGVHGRQMRQMFVLGEYEVGCPVRLPREKENWRNIRQILF